MTNHSVIKVDDSYTHLRSIDNQFFNVTITDPPYDKEIQDNLFSGTLVKECAIGLNANVPRYHLPFEALHSRQLLITELLRVTKRWVLIFCGIEDLGRFCDIAPNEWIRGGVWYKCNAMGQLTHDRPASAYEAIAILHRSERTKQWNGSGSYAIWRCNGTRGKKNRHPNEKPMNLMLRLASMFSNRGETVFDPFAGSGAIGEACKRLGRGYVGWERDQGWVYKASQRLKGCCIEMDDKVALKLCGMNG